MMHLIGPAIAVGYKKKLYWCCSAMRLKSDSRLME